MSSWTRNSGFGKLHLSPVKGEEEKGVEYEKRPKEEWRSGKREGVQGWDSGQSWDLNVAGSVTAGKPAGCLVSPLQASLKHVLNEPTVS